MRILIVTPRQPRATGNFATAERHRQGLRNLGHSVRIVETSLAPDALDDAADAIAPDLIHLLHAYRSGLPWLLSRQKGTSTVVTLTGTDIHHGVFDPEEAPVIEEVLSSAGAVLTQNILTYTVLKESRPDLSGRLRYLPAGVVLGDEVFSPRARLKIPEQTPLFLHPAGVRPVKGNRELLRWFDPLTRETPLRLAFCGPILDADYGERFLADLKTRPWADYLGVVPPGAVPSAMGEADVILNHSESEGLSTTLMEATVIGRPILARDIPGNAAVVIEGESGYLYRTQEEFLHRARLLAGDPALRGRLGRPHPELYRPEEESARLEAIYRAVLRPRA